MLLVIDNYDSFTYNLVQLFGRMTDSIEVRRNDELSLDDVASLRPARILLSPGPGRPEDAGITVGVIKRFGPTIPILGVCLGHQAIGLAFGGDVIHAPSLMHGRVSSIHHEERGLYAGMPAPFTATRYHSLIVKRETLPSELMVTSWTEDGLIMGIRHAVHPIDGVQFHPESIMTEQGDRLLRNWLGARS
jgi:anthranilate synthase/aminodeoxychorismate synthase-like glutamine amidotransferase